MKFFGHKTVLKIVSRNQHIALNENQNPCKPLAGMKALLAVLI
jgi:hypothetical protein